MFQFINIKEQFLKERAKAQRLSVELEKAKSDLDYIAMMTDVELDTEGDDEDEQEV